MTVPIARRKFVVALAGAAAWPLAARAQQGERMRRIGALLPGDENDPAGKPLVSAFNQALADLGWTYGRNVRIDPRWAGGDTNRMRALAQELVGLQPDIILAITTAATGDVQPETHCAQPTSVAGAVAFRRVIHVRCRFFPDEDFAWPFNLELQQGSGHCRCLNSRTKGVHGPQKRRSYSERGLRAE